MRWIELTEKRRNPEINVKKTTLEELSKYEGHNVFVSFVSDVGVRSHSGKLDFDEVDPNDREESGIQSRGRAHNASGHKIGINPKSAFNTPNGIYCYPINYVIALFKKKGSDFATYRPFIYVIEPTETLIVSDQYTQEMLDSDIQNIKEKYDIDDETMQQMLESSYQDSHGSSQGSIFWSLTRRVSKYLSSGENSPNKWSAIFRMLGYGGFFDSKGQGIIHPNEPLQCVFFSKNAFRVVETIHNKSRRLPRNPEGMLRVIQSGAVSDAEIATYLLSGESGEILMDRLDDKYITDSVVKHLKKYLYSGFFNVDVVMLVDFLLRKGKMSTSELMRAMKHHLSIVKQIYALDQSLLSDDVIRYAYDAAIGHYSLTVKNMNYFIKSGILTDHEIINALTNQPGVITRALEVPERLYPELFEIPQAIVAFPMEAMKYVPDVKMSYLTPYLHAHKQLYSYFGPNTMQAIARKYPMSILDAYETGQYDPPFSIWKVVIETALVSSGSRSLLHLALENFIENNNMRMAVYITNKLEHFEVSHALSRKPTNVLKYLNYIKPEMAKEIIASPYFRILPEEVKNNLQQKIAP